MLLRQGFGHWDGVMNNSLMGLDLMSVDGLMDRFWLMHLVLNGALWPKTV